MKVFRLLLVGAAAVLLLAGCGGGDEETARGEPARATEHRGNLEKEQMTMEGYASPPDGGILLADRLGYFADAGLDMTIYGAVRPEYTIGYAVDGSSAVVVTQMPEVVRAQAEGKPVVAVGSVLPEPVMAMIWLPGSGIDGIRDLKGKTIAIPGSPYQKDFLEYVLEGAGLTLADVAVKAVRNNSVYALAGGRADAAFGASWSADGASLESRGLEPVITKVTDLGIPAYEELVLATNRKSFAGNPQLYRRILGVVTRGAAAANEDPQAASEAIVDKTLELAPPKPTEAGVEATAPLLSQTGRIDRQKLEGLIEWMYEQGMIRSRPPVSRLLAASAEGSGSPGKAAQ